MFDESYHAQELSKCRKWIVGIMRVIGAAISCWSNGMNGCSEVSIHSTNLYDEYMSGSLGRCWIW